MLPIARDNFLFRIKKMFAVSIIWHSYFTGMPCYLKTKQNQITNQNPRLGKVYLMYINGSCLYYSCIFIKPFLTQMVRPELSSRWIPELSYGARANSQALISLLGNQCHKLTFLLLGVLIYDHFICSEKQVRHLYIRHCFPGREVMDRARVHTGLVNVPCSTQQPKQRS